MPYVATRHRRGSEAGGRVRLGWAAAIAAGLLGATGHSLAARGPKEVSDLPVAEGRAAMKAEQRRLSDEIGEAERNFQGLTEAGPRRAEAGAVLEGAIARQRHLLTINPHAGPEQQVRLDRLLAARDTERARAADREIGELEESADQARQAGRRDDALEKLRAALELQRAIDNSGADVKAKNFGREIRIAQAIEEVEAEPVARAFETAQQQARAAVAAERWSEALAAYGRAREAQARINRDHARTRFANLPVLDEIDAEIASLSAAGLAAEIDVRVKGADAAAGPGRAEEAAGLYRAAADLQRRLNRQFPRSRFGSTARLEELEIRRQTVLAAEQLAAAAALDREAAVALRQRQVRAAGQKIRAARTLLAGVERDFPKTRHFDGTLKIRLAYLESRHAELRAWQDRIYAQLVPLPDVEDRLLLRTETPQELYGQIMRLNPSRNPGPAWPVDSVNWHDAREFCRRLSWLLGARVRLPTEEEYRGALGDGEVEGWSAESAAGHSQEVARQAANENGFCDLAGNLAEWLEPEAEGAAQAPVAGGSYREPLAELKRGPLRSIDKNERARHIGFRFVVELARE